MSFHNLDRRALGGCRPFDANQLGAGSTAYAMAAAVIFLLCVAALSLLPESGPCHSDAMRSLFHAVRDLPQGDFSIVPWRPVTNGLWLF